MTVRLLSLAAQHWQTVDGFAIGRGVDLEELPAHRVANYIWWFFTRNANHTDEQKFRAKIWRPPPGKVVSGTLDKRSPWSAEAETKAFSALKAQIAPGK